MKPFGQTLFCRLVIGRLVGKGDTFMDLPLKVVYELLAALLVPGIILIVKIGPFYLYTLYPTNTFVSSLYMFMSIMELLSTIWLLWFVLVSLLSRSLAWGDVEDRVLATLITGVVPYCIYGSAPFAEIVRTESVATVTFIKLTLFCCFLVATVVPTFSVWRLQRR